MSVRAKKGLGQHFLAEPSVVRQIVDAVDAPPEAQVIEIGPGEGAMTGQLLARYPSLIALEIDGEAIAHLRQRLPQLDLREGDVLDADWGALLREASGKHRASGAGPTPRSNAPATAVGSVPLSEGDNPDSASDDLSVGNSRNVIVPLAKGDSFETERERSGGYPQDAASPPEAQPAGTSGARGAGTAPLHIVGNLPYYITSPILFSLLDAREHVARAVVMVQKEVADRIVAPEGSKTYGTLSVYFSLLARAELLFDVPPEAFRPPPKVDSAVIAIDFADPPEAGLDSAALRRVVRAAFGQRRKMLRNSLKPLAQETSREIPDWAATLRPEQVSPADFVRLTHAFFTP